MIALSEAELGIVAGILREHLPGGIDVGVFGSRARGGIKRRSDLDLVLEAAEPLPPGLLALLAEAFEESDLPFKVDLVDRRVVSEDFGRIIDQARVPLGKA